MGMRVGTSFSPRRCSRFGLAAQATFRQLLELGFDLIRVSAYWDQVSAEGYSELDRLLDAADAAGQAVVLTVGMKAMQWPEFYIPADVEPVADARGRVGRDPGLAGEVLAFVSETVTRYRDRARIVAWQVENEPFNRSGPHHWWIDPDLVRREIEAVRALDPRPIVLNAFNRFDSALDAESRPRHGPFGLRRLAPEKALLRLLRPSDVLGLDVYTSIGERRADSDWVEVAARWLREARRRGSEAWIIEAQAEPWESSRDTWANPLSLSPEDLLAVYQRLVNAGFTTVLLWGCEYWLWRAAEGDARWLDAAKEVLDTR